MRNNIYEWHEEKMKSVPVILHERKYEKDGWQGGTNLHENIEFIVAFEGEGYVACDDRQVDVTAGDIICINAYVAHSVHAVHNFSSQCLIVDSSFCRLNGIDTTSLHFRERIRDSKLFSLFETLVEAGTSSDPYASVALRGALLSFMAHLASNHRADGMPATPPPNSIQIAISYMKYNLARPITLAELSNESGLSRTHFAHRFKDALGMPPLSYLHNLRMERACTMLSETDTPVAEISAACGFESPSYFARAFRKTFGVIPTAYREMQKRGGMQ